MDYWLLMVATLFFTDIQRVWSLFVTDLNVPEIVDFRDNVTLSCSYDMSGHTLNSVKWYKDKMEFFRYSPMMHPVYIKFPVVGVQMPDGKYFCNESTCRVDLSMLSAKSSGVYKCEVSGDAPHFQLAAKEDNMTVAALPQSDPLIESFNPMYRMEDFLSAICTSDYSSLPTKLTWYINGEPASLSELQPNVDTSISAHGYILRRQKLQVHFYLSGPRFFHAGKILQLKCVAEIESYPELIRETSLNAALIPYDNLNNQMLIHAGNSGGAKTDFKALNHRHTIVMHFTIAVICATVLYTWNL
uniref:Ig-like domain-containing protein n=1 Tax=Glossina brevipalpis TaxID=37001 RepID=A0A1A9WMZ8_9MUSC